MSQFAAVLAHPAFQADPLQTISTHIRNTNLQLEQERQRQQQLFGTKSDVTGSRTSGDAAVARGKRKAADTMAVSSAKKQRGGDDAGSASAVPAPVNVSASDGGGVARAFHTAAQTAESKSKTRPAVVRIRRKKIMRPEILAAFLPFTPFRITLIALITLIRLRGTLLHPPHPCVIIIPPTL
jgi:hypothetical protein